MKTEYCVPMVAVILTENLPPFLFSTIINASQKGKVSEMIESKQEVSKDLEKALQALEQAKQRVANEKKKQNEKKRKAEKALPHNLPFIIPKMKVRAIQNDEGKGTEKPR